jgi:prepilin-type processing-associated H-X9-DG protein
MPNTLAVWGVSLLPFVEQQSLYNDYQPTKTMDNNTNPSGTAGATPNNQNITQQFISAYLCPSDMETKKLRAMSGVSFLLAPGSYRGIAGRHVSNVSTSHWDGGETLAQATYGRYRGIFHYVGQVDGSSGGYLPFESFASLTDGSSNITMFSERHFQQDGDQQTRSTFWAGTPAFNLITANPEAKGNLLGNYWERCIAGAPAYTGSDAATQKIYFCGRVAGAYHSNGLNVTLGDGSVRFVSTNINMLLWANYAAIAIGEMKTGL